MSGGVDSSVAALLLKEQGLDVIGATLSLFSEDDIVRAQENERDFCAFSGIEDARRVAEKLGIEHVVIDLRESFRKNVMSRFAESYLRGETPNPCIYCNRTIKFGEMLERAQELGCDYIATGHYAVNSFDERSGRWLLSRPSDRHKEQTYVLYTLTQEQLSHTLFPLGTLDKSRVRELAGSAGLINSKKPDSQDICFVPDGKYAEFIKKFTGADIRSGSFISTDGRVLGEHRGIINYTVGQRKGLGISLGKPAYVVSKDAAANTVILGGEADLYTRSLTAYDVNLISVEKLDAPMRITAKTRYSQNETPALLTKLENGEYRVDFDEPQRAVTSGQSAVFYDGDIVVGGGTIR